MNFVCVQSVLNWWNQRFLDIFRNLKKILDKSDGEVIMRSFSLLNYFLVKLAYKLLNKILFIVFSQDL